MTRFEITLGLLAIIGTVAVSAIVGLREEDRMLRSERGWQTRSVESGAQMFHQYCANCHGENAVGSICPPLNETSGLHGGDLGVGVAWRLEELGWDSKLPYEYVYSVIASGRTISTRPDRYTGNRVAPPPPPTWTPTPPGTPPPVGTRAPTPTPAPLMAMPAWSQDYGGPLRPDQIRDLANYVVAFRDKLPDLKATNAYTDALKMAGQYRTKPTPTTAASAGLTTTLPSSSMAPTTSPSSVSTTSASAGVSSTIRPAAGSATVLRTVTPTP